MTEQKKQSLIAGALTSSAGVFLSKLLGLFYVVPFVAMAQGNDAFYSKAYSLYDILLNICTAGIPFAVATLVAKYYERKDYKTVLLVRKLSMGLLMTTGLVMAVLLLLFAGNYAVFTFAEGASEENIQKFTNVLRILSLSLFLVPFLSSYRGFYQGLKEMKAYAVSQVLEQFARVGLLLGLGAFCVYLLSLDGIWAVYMAILATGLSALITIFYFKKLDRKEYRELVRLARRQSTDGKDRADLLRELIVFGIPFLVVALLGNSMTIVNSTFFERTLAGVDPALATKLNGIIHLQCNKLTSIPQVMAIGFSAGLVPYITVSYEKRDFRELRKNILDCLDTVCYIAIPLCFCLLVLARPIYFLMYGEADLDYGTVALAFSSFLALTGTISPICSNLMLSLRLRKTVIVFLGCSFLVKLVSFFPLMHWTGYTGAITSSVLSGMAMIALALWFIARSFKVSYRRLFRHLIVIGLALISTYGSFVLLRWVGMDLACTSKIVTFFELAVHGLVGCFAYVLTTSFFQLPQRIFHMKLGQIGRRLIRR